MDVSFVKVPVNVPKLSGFDKSHQNQLIDEDRRDGAALRGEQILVALVKARELGYVHRHFNEGNIHNYRGLEVGSCIEGTVILLHNRVFNA